MGPLGLLRNCTDPVCASRDKGRLELASWQVSMMWTPVSEGWLSTLTLKGSKLVPGAFAYLRALSLLNNGTKKGSLLPDQSSHTAFVSWFTWDGHRLTGVLQWEPLTRQQLHQIIVDGILVEGPDSCLLCSPTEHVPTESGQL